MVIYRADSSLRAASLEPVSAKCAAPPEEEVTRLFDQWRDPLLGYVVTLGLTIHEGEEIIQEVFLSLFQHLRQDKSRENLRGWLFRVGHNLALKRRYSSGRRLLKHGEEDALDELPDPDPNPEE